MSLHWSDFPGAPSPGTALGAPDDLADSVTFLRPGGFPLMVLNDGGGGLRAFVNLCPHQFLPLDQRAAGVLSADGTRLICSNHNAVFDAVTGEGTGGEGLGCALSPVPLRLVDGQVVIG